MRRGAGAVVTKTGKCIFPRKKEAVYRLSKKCVPPSVQRWLMAPWEDFAACVWNFVTNSVPASALLCLPSPPFEPALCTEVILVFWEGPCMSSPIVFAISKTGSTAFCS